MHINNFEPDTFLWLLEKFDVPYIEAEWNVLRDRAYAKDPYKMNGMSVIGKYLAKQLDALVLSDIDHILNGYTIKADGTTKDYIKLKYAYIESREYQTHQVQYSREHPFHL